MLVRHNRNKSLPSLELFLAQFADGPAIRFVKFEPKSRFADPAHCGFLDDQRMLSRGNQKHDELHPDLNDLGTTQTATMIRQVFSHSAGMEITIGIVHGIVDGSSDIPPFIRIRC